MDSILPQSLLDSLRGYPRWLVVACAIVAIAAAAWILGKLLKWGLWLALIALLAGGTILALRELFR